MNKAPMDMQGLLIEELSVEGYEKVLKVSNPEAGLTGIICIHNTVLGPALGGIRLYPYPTFEAALTDVKRLARGMTHKSAVAGMGLGGGKSVIIADSKKKTKELLAAFAEAVNLLEGVYTCAEDVGISPSDINWIAKHTPYVVGVEHEKSSGNPSPFTAWGVFRGIQATLRQIYGSDSVEGREIVVQGLGNVGGCLAELLFWHGAKLTVSDIDWDKTLKVATKLGSTACPAEDVLSISCDILAPCAMGGILNAQTIANLSCKGVAGSANNQLLNDADGDLLREKGILYAPDFVINAGGLINVAQELEVEGYHPTKGRHLVDKIYDQLIHVYELAEKNQISTSQAAISLAEYRVKYEIGKRGASPVYHHALKNG